jgi:flagellar protein FlgJ
VVRAALATHAPLDPGADKLARMKSVAGRFEGVFVEQLFKAMRETVPQDGELSGGAGEEVFTSLLDEHVAGEAPQQWHRGVGDAIVSRLTTAAPAEDAGTKAVHTPIRPHPPERDVP